MMTTSVDYCALGEGCPVCHRSRERVEAALRLISPDDITPTGLRVLRQALGLTDGDDNEDTR